MSYKIQFTNQAESDLKAIYSYLIFNLNSPEYAIKQLNLIEAKLKTLTTFPNRFPMHKSNFTHHLPIRKFIVKHYIIFYSVDEIAELTTILRRLSYKQEFKLE